MTAEARTVTVDPFDARLAVHAPPILRAFNEAGVLSAADIHIACRLAALGRANDDALLLGAALAVRAPRLGHVCIDLATARDTVTSDLDEPADLQSLPWPEAGDWIKQLEASPLVAVGDDGPADRPLRLHGTRLYVDRYWREERKVAADLRARSLASFAGVDPGVLAAGLDRLFGADPSDLQRLAGAAAVQRRFTVVAGGPGTGKTTTVARILALLYEQADAAGQPPPRVALAAPTGKAAARLEEAVHSEAGRIDVADDVRTRLQSVSASTLHRLLGWRPGTRSRFRHHRGNRLPHDVVIVDETSMVSLSMMAKLVEAVRTGARLILVGDQEQLTSVEAGAVLGDIVDADREGIIVLRRVHRYGGAIAELASAIQAGDAATALAVLRAGRPDVRWIEADVAEPDAAALLDPVRLAVVEAARRVVDAARAGDGRAALDGMGAIRVLCAHRRGPYGTATWMATIEGWLTASIPGYGTGGRWYVGRPLLVTENDYGLRLYNGDTGVIVDTGDGRVTAVFERAGELMEVSSSRLSAADTVHAMTVHKSQGSQFQSVAVLVPDETSRILTRELLYTAITRAQESLTIVGTADSIAAAVRRPIARASGLREQLWGQG